jgi:hypothetical protein
MSIRDALPGLLLCLASLPASAGEPSTETRQEDLQHWANFHEVKRTRKATRPGALYDVVLPPDVFGSARFDLGDLRLVDAAGRFVPYALRTRTPIDEQQPLGVRVFDRVTNADHSVQVSLDLGEQPGEYDQLDVDVPGTGFVRALHVEGGNDGKSWSKVLDNVHVVRLEERDQANRPIDRHRFHLAPTRFRYLRVQLRPDRGLENDRPQVRDVRVFHTVRVPGEDVSHVADLGRREPVRRQGQPASAWVIDLGAAEVPVRRLTVRVAQAEFSRPFEVDAQYDRTFSPIGVAGTLRPGKPGSGEAVIDLNQEYRGRRLRLYVIDAGNLPLTIEEVRFTAAARQVVFAVPAGLKEPLRLYTGNPEAPAPNYEFAAGLRPRLDPAPTRLELGEGEANPVYQPPPLPWTERWPYLVDAILAGACVVLLVILVLLARHAIRRHDAAPQAT